MPFLVRIVNGVSLTCALRGPDRPRIETIAIVLLVLLAALRVRAMWRSGSARARMRRARGAERSARELLARHGFDVLAEQAPGSLVLRVDGAPSAHALRVDYLVARDGKRYVAEVKSGALAPSLDHAPTRRQILEYCAAFDVDGALLVDAERAQIRHVALPVRDRGPRPLLVLALGIVLGVALAVLAR